jgi:gas vesicle protein
MTEKIDSKISYFLVGLGVALLIGILFAPKSGEDAREYLSRKVNEGNEYAQKKVQDLRVRAEDLVERGKEVVTQEKRKIAAAVHEGRETYQRQKDTRYLSEGGWR